jgi:hypothetical protein
MSDPGLLITQAMSYVQRPVILKFVFHERTSALYARSKTGSWRGNKEGKLLSHAIRHTTVQVTWHCRERHDLTQARSTVRVVRATLTRFGLYTGKIIFNTYKEDRE